MPSAFSQILLAVLGLGVADPSGEQSNSQDILTETVYLRYYVTPYANGTTCTSTETITPTQSLHLERRATSAPKPLSIVTSVPSNETIIVAETLMNWSYLTPAAVSTTSTSQAQAPSSAAPVTAPLQPTTSVVPLAAQESSAASSLVPKPFVTPTFAVSSTYSQFLYTAPSYAVPIPISSTESTSVMPSSTPSMLTSSAMSVDSSTMDGSTLATSATTTRTSSRITQAVTTTSQATGGAAQGAIEWGWGLGLVVGAVLV